MLDQPKATPHKKCIDNNSEVATEKTTPDSTVTVVLLHPIVTKKEIGAPNRVARNEC